MTAYQEDFTLRVFWRVTEYGLETILGLEIL